MVPSESVLNDAKNVCGFGADVGDLHVHHHELARGRLLQVGELGIGDDGGAVDTGDDELEVAVAHRLPDARGLILQRGRLDAGLAAGFRVGCDAGVWADASDGLWVTVASPTSVFMVR